jgi:hypothetical protein
MTDYVPPDRAKDAFNCPHCGAFAHQTAHSAFAGSQLGHVQAENLSFTLCSRCHRYAVWYQLTLVYPLLATAPLASSDMPDDVAADYNEARAIFSTSPRGAAALLRLAIQKLCKHLGQSGTRLDEDIGDLVKHGLSRKIQQALDAVRVIGNNAVHPGEIDLRDNTDIAFSLFQLTNMIVVAMITEPRQVDEIYSKLPEGARQAVERRDKSP